MNLFSRLDLRVLLGVAFCLVFSLAVFLDWRRTPVPQPALGSISRQEVIAPFDVVLQGEVDVESTTRMKEDMLSRVKPVYDLDQGAETRIFSQLESFFTALREEKVSGKGETPLENISLLLSEPVKHSTIRNLLTLENLDDLAAGTREIVKTVLTSGIVSFSEIQMLKKSRRDRIVVRKGTEEFEKPVAGILGMGDVENRVAVLADARFPYNLKLKGFGRELALSVLTPNLVFDAGETRFRQEKALAQVATRYTEAGFRKGEKIVEKGGPITARQFNYLRQLAETVRARTPAKTQMAIFFSALGLSVLLLIVFIVYLKNYEPAIYARRQNLLLIFLASALLLGTVMWVNFFNGRGQLIPVAALSMLLAMLLSSRVSLLVTVLLSMMLAIIFNNDLQLMLMYVAGGVTGIYAVLHLRRRSQFLFAGMCVGLANLICLFCLGMITEGGWDKNILTEASWGLANGFLSAAVVMLLLPVFEYLFKLTTSIHLLELSDHNHPLLQELTGKALGTYQHSLVVGNLAADACEAIGANGLLARVGAYYHDIGKTLKPGYFFENQKEDRSEHEKLSPQMSRLIILNHVKEGVELARRHKLNQALIDIIEQHHGTSLMHFFYCRALEDADTEEKIDEGVFRYPGPRPQTRESAVVMLADSVEAAARTLEEPTPPRIADLVKEIVNNKFIDGQLDECDLSLKNLHQITESFCRILNGIYHWRVRYPKLDEEREKTPEIAGNGDDNKSEPE